MVGLRAYRSTRQVVGRAVAGAQRGDGQTAGLLAV